MEEGLWVSNATAAPSGVARSATLVVPVALIFVLTTEAVRMGFYCYHCGAEFSWRMHLGRHRSTTHSRSSKRAADGLPDAVAGRGDVFVTAHSPYKRARRQLMPSRTRGSAGPAGLSHAADQSRQRGDAGESRIATDKTTEKDAMRTNPREPSRILPRTAQRSSTRA